MSQKFFKVILGGKSATRGEFEWNLPSANEDGSWTPGSWHSVEPPINAPCNALHVTDKPREWWRHGADCYAVETAGEESEYDPGMSKKGVEKCRLLRKLTREELARDHNIVLVKDGETAKVVAGQICFADGNSTVEADGNSTVEADGNSTVRAYGNSTVRAYGNSTVRADGNSTVRADGNSTVEAYGNSTVNQFHRYFKNESKVTVKGDAVCIDRRSGKPEIKVAETALEGEKE